ncbi:glycerophosphoryl diester phosphodiesterase membrane domain-containing protein [Streptococcus catagoni]|uniref:glycerophosphoryl diester phosphodiesterase membrane domain-containing protein n=1 Tax=Streptococcus catagoni TaxID=2654874 RepID=UPI0014091BBD|nr:glycerophosphodiester phosphodiesterase [Streptococcus catagoni]
MKFLSDLLSLMKKIRFEWLLKASIFQLLFVTITNLVLSELFYLILDITGQYHLDKDNIFNFIKNPFALAFFFLYFFFLVAFIHLEFFILYRIIADKRLSRKKFKKTISYYAKHLWRYFSGWQLFPFLAYVLLTIPVLKIGLSSVITEKLYIPDFIISELSKTETTKYVLYLLLAFMFYLNLRFIYFLPLLSLKRMSSKDALIESWRRTKKTSFSLLLKLLCLSAFVLSLTAVLIMGILALVLFLDPQGNQFILQALSLTLIWEIIFFSTIFFKLSMAMLLKNDISPNGRQKEVRVKSKKNIISFVLLLLMTLGFAVGSFGKLSLFQNPSNKKVIAHRGLVSAGVENSLEALEGASRVKSDAVELDLMLTKDNKFVVSHDNSLERLAGLERSIRDMTLSQVEAVTIYQGSFKSKLVSFETFYKKAQALHMPLLIELKPTGTEPANYVDLFLELYKKLGIGKENKVMSLDLKVMEELEKKAPYIKTGYVIPIQVGFLGEENIDFYVIEDFSYRSRLSAQALLKKKEIFVWTINEPERMEYYLQKPIQAMITDDPSEVKRLSRKIKREDSYFDRLVRIAFSLF